MKIRSLLFPDDWPALGELDTSFTTDTIYRVEQDGLSFRLTEEKVDPPLRKRYALNVEDNEDRAAVEEETALWDHAVVAEVEDAIVGFAAAHFSKWNRRAEIRHLYVAPEWRNQGLGKQLLVSVRTFATKAGPRCLWVETQNVNLPAVKFYLSQGFTLCGLDRSLYDRKDDPNPEVALFFTCEL